ncbi:MAG: ABC transporter ATP-binding protein [Eubacterium sp.]|nr:ABC transporter ATP-binding protein [Eubacterium sp.]
MQLHWTSIVTALFEWMLFSGALWSIAGKLGWEKPWNAWIPGLRFFALGRSIALNRECRFCGIMDVVFLAGALSKSVVPKGRVNVALSLTVLIIFLYLFIYRIRIFLRILEIFGLGKRWLILFLIANWLPLLLIGFGKQYQPRGDVQLEESWEAGTRPAQIPGTAESHARALSSEGLSIDIRERTVKEYGKKRYLLKDICLNIPNKSMVLLLGGSGAGKTTLINAVIGYEKADASILLNGSDVYRDYDSVKYRIGFVPQKNLIRGKDTVMRTIDDAAQMRLPKNVTQEESRGKIAEVLDLLGLSAGSEGLVEKKSGGQLRRISIAMELVTDPELFVLDEPDSGLDGAIAREIFRKLRQVADEGRIVLVVSHTPDRVIDLFDKVIVLARDSGRVGRLAFYGSPAEARTFFGKETMEDIVMSINRVDEGGEGRADEMIEKYAGLTSGQKEGAAS